MTTMARSKENNLERVWEPLKIGKVEFRNRILQPAHSSQHGDPREHVFSDRQIAYFRERAKGGVALSVTETVAAARSAKGSFFNVVDVYDEACIPSMERMGEAVHEHGGRLMVQLASMGVHDKGRMFIDRPKPIWGASRLPSLMHNEMPQVMGPVEFKELAHDFGISAANVKRGGLDGVELHGAHSYGLAQFMSPTYNKRTDAYGGTPAKRCRLLIDCAEQVRVRVGDNFVVGVRLSWDEFMGPEGGITPEQSEEQISVLADTGLFDYFSISAGGYHTIHLALPGMEDTAPEGWLAPFSKRAKEIVGDRAKVFVVGKIRDLHTAEAILRDDAADMVALARQLLTDPFTVKKTEEGREDEIIRCNRCNECAGRLWEHRELICALNPVSGRESYWGDGSLKRVPKKKVKKVLIIGGGPAGMKCAALAAKRGHAVTLIEQRDVLGGHLRLYEQLPGMSDWGIAIDNLTREVRNSGVQVTLNSAADLDTLREFGADEYVIATGATYEDTGLSLYRPERESIPGSELPHVLDVGSVARLVLEDPQALGNNVLILDETGSSLPFAVAEIMAKAGTTVEVLSPRMYAGERIYRNLDILFIFPRLKQLGVRVTHQHFVEAIRPGEVDVYDIWAGPGEVSTRRDVDSVVMSILRVPNDALFNAAEATLKNVTRIGDVAAPRDATAVIYDGEELGRRL